MEISELGLKLIKRSIMIKGAFCILILHLLLLNLALCGQLFIFFFLYFVNLVSSILGDLFIF